MTNKRIIKEATKILESLTKLQTRCINLVNNANEGRVYLPPHIQNVIDTIEELGSFDLEDSIVSAEDYE